MTRTGRHWTVASTIAAFALVGSLSSCTSPPDTSRPVPNVARSAVPSGGDAQVVAAFDAFMNAYVKAYGSDDPIRAAGGLTPFGGVDGGGLDVNLQLASASGLRAAGRPSWSSPTISVDLPYAQATATACFDPATWRTVGVTSHRPSRPSGTAGDGAPRPAYPGEPAGRYAVVATLYQDADNNWLVFSVVAHRSQGC